MLNTILDGFDELIVNHSENGFQEYSLLKEKYSNQDFLKRLVEFESQFDKSEKYKKYYVDNDVNNSFIKKVGDKVFIYQNFEPFVWKLLKDENRELIRQNLSVFRAYVNKHPFAIDRDVLETMYFLFTKFQFLYTDDEGNPQFDDEKIEAYLSNP